SVFITHQAKVLVPRGYEWFSPWINSVCQRHIRRFDEVWVPDQPGSGLTDPFTIDLPHQKAVGWLSRFQRINGHGAGQGIIAVVSGPDPQRTIFRELVLKQMKELGQPAMLVCGEPANTYRFMDGNVEVVSHLSAKDLAKEIASSAVVISRSGYSTVMDLIAMGKRAIFVPTPQQPEQL